MVINCFGVMGRSRAVQQDLEELCMDKNNQILRTNNRARVSAVPVGKPDVMECNPVWTPGELSYAISQHAPAEANAFIMGDQEDERHGFYKCGIQFYKTS